MASFKQMTGDGIIRRAAAQEKIRYTDVHIEPGFNPAGRHDSQDEDDDALFAYIMGGGRLPPIEVRPREEGGVWIVEGHRRYVQIGRAVSAGAPMKDENGDVWVYITQFVGNDIARHARVLTSNENKKLTSLQIAERYNTLVGFGLSHAGISKLVHKSPSHVSQMLVLANANHDVQNLVKEGSVSTSVAIEMVRKHGEKAASEMAKPKAVRVWAPPAQLTGPILTGVEALLQLLPEDDYPLLTDKGVTTVSLEVPTALLLSLLDQMSAVVEARKEAQK